MGEWPVDLAIVGFIILLISSFRKKRAVAVMTVVGYIGGFVLGVIFNFDSVDPGGGTTNNLWVIWTVAYFISIVIGGIADAILKVQKKRLNQE